MNLSPRVDREDGGSYSCTTGGSRNNINLVVQHRPEILPGYDLTGFTRDAFVYLDFLILLN